MNKWQIVLLLLVVGTLTYVGSLVYYEMAVGLENNPHIDEIGGPPVFSDLRLVLLVTVIAVVMCGVCLKYGKEEEVDKND